MENSLLEDAYRRQCYLHLNNGRMNVRIRERIPAATHSGFESVSESDSNFVVIVLNEKKDRIVKPNEC